MGQTFEKAMGRFAGAEVGILGFGVSNKPLAALLADAGARVTVFDRDAGIDREPWESRGVRMVLGSGYLDAVRGEYVFRSPGFRPDIPALERARGGGAVVTTEMELFLELCPCTIIGVTGSDGKTTTATLVSELLAASGKRSYLGGNIGAPLLSRIPEMRPEDFAVAELSSFQLMDITRSPHVAVITNITPNHLDWHRDMEEYAAAKRRILEHQDERGFAVLNGRNPLTAGLPVRGRKVLFGADDLPDGRIGAFLDPAKLLIRGKHNIENFAAAYAAVSEWVTRDAAEYVAETFPGVAHRNQFILEAGGVSFYNDSIASSPTRTIATLSSHTAPVVLICGGYDKKIPYEPLAERLPELCRAAVLMGTTAGAIRAAAESVPGCPELIDASDMGNAVRKAFSLARPGDDVVLSPASASFDMYEDFEERGLDFVKAVKEESGCWK